MPQLTARLLLASLLAAGCGAGEDTGDGAPAAPDASPGDGPDAGCADCEPALRLTLFVFDQQAKQIVRLSDDDGDGDMMEPGEVTVYFDNTGPLGIYNSMGMVALGPRELLAGDNLAGDNNDDSNIVRLLDESGDGDALDEGEASMWWSGALPGGGALTFPVAIVRGPDGAIYAVQNDAFDEEPDAIYRLSDDDADGDVDDEGEATLHADLADEVTPQFLDFVFDGAGAGYGLDIRNPEDPNNASLDRVAPDGSARTELLDAVGLYTLTQADQELILPGSAAGPITYDPDSGEIIFATIDRYARLARHLVAVRDLNESGRIDTPGELRVLFDEEDADLDRFGAFRAMTVLPDRSIVATDAGTGRIIRLVDESGDGDVNDPGEIRVLYDEEAAAAAGVHVIENLFTLAAHTEPAD